MTPEQTKQILTILQINYPQSFRGWTAEQKKAYLAMWSEAFRDTPADIVTAAVKSIVYTDTREFAPNIGQVNGKIRELTSVELSGADAWKAIEDAVHSGSPAAEWKKLPESIRKITSPRELDDWAFQTEPSVFRTVVKGQFLKAYNVQADREREMQMLPQSVKKLLNASHKPIELEFSANSKEDGK